MTEERIITTIEKLRNAANNAGDFKAFLLIVKSFSEPAPPKDWQERLHKVAELTQYISETGDGTEAGFNSIDVAISRLKDVATLKQQIKELEDANRYLARSNGKLILELRKMQEHNLE